MTNSKLVIFDMDQTIIHREFLKKGEKTQPKIDGKNIVVYKETDEYLSIAYVRPYIIDFLKKLQQLGLKFAIMSSGGKKNVQDVVSHVFSDFHWEFLLGIEDIKVFDDGNLASMKLLSNISTLYPEYNRDNMLLIDDLDMFVQVNLEHDYKAIRITPYYAKDLAVEQTFAECEKCPNIFASDTILNQIKVALNI
jgi:hypothetical protein